MVSVPHPHAIASRTADPRWALAGLSLAMLLSSLGTSAANVALPTLEAEFGASFGEVQWVVLSYLLAVTTLVVAAGRVGDLVGRRRLLVGGIATFTGASALCAAASSLWMLVAARALQGAGAAVMMALTLAVAAEMAPRARTGRAMGLLGSMSALGTALGPSLGGALLAGLGWPWIFVLNVPVGLVALVLAVRHLPADGGRVAGDRTAFDVTGIVLLAAALGAYALAMTIENGRLRPLTVGLLLASLGLAGLLLLAERRARTPLIDAAMLRSPGLRAGLVTNGLVSTVMMATLVVGPFYLARALGLGPALIGLTMSVGPVVVAISGVPAGRAADRLGPRRLTIVGLALMAGGAFALATAPTGLGVPGYVAPLVVVTLGYALFQTANTTAVMAAAPADGRGVVSGMLNLSRNLGLVTGASVMGAVFTLAAGTTHVATASASAAATGMRATFVLAAALVVLALAVAVGTARRDGRRPAGTGSAPAPAGDG